MSIYGDGKGFCPDCRNLYKIRKDGRVRKHERKRIIGGTYTWTKYEDCPGGGKEPDETPFNRR